jgi:hypothetical protein
VRATECGTVIANRNGDMKTLFSLQLTTAAMTVLGATASIARAADSLPEPRAEYAPSRWMVRMHAGLRWAAPSQEQSLLSADGYASSPKAVFTGDFAWYLEPAVGVGAWAEHSLRKPTPESGGPTLTESVYAVGAEVPLRFVATSTCEVLLMARLGYGWSFLDFGGHAEPVRAPAYGGDFGVLFPKAHLSFVAGYLDGPTARPGNAGRAYNFGGLSLLVGGVIDG